MKKNYLIIIVSIILGFSAGIINASFEKTFLGNARYISMNGAYVGMSDDEVAVFVNPAGLVQIEKGAGLTYGNMHTGLNFGSLMRVNAAGVYQFPKIAAFGLGVDYFSADIDDNISYSESLAVLSVARHMADVVSIGFNIKIPQHKSQFNNETSSSGIEPGIDLGIMVFQNESLSFGAAFYDIAQLSFNEQEEGNNTIPFSAKMGASFNSGLQNSILSGLCINTDVAYVDQYIDLLSGVELRIKSLSVRAGIYLQEFTKGAEMSLGLGYIIGDMYNVNYGMKYPITGIDGSLGTHFISGSMVIGRKLEKPTYADEDEKVTESLKEEPEESTEEHKTNEDKTGESEGAIEIEALDEKE